MDQEPQAGGEARGPLPGGLGVQGLDAWRALLHAHAVVVGRIERDLAAAELLPLSWYDALIELATAPGKQLRQRDLARAVLLTRSGLSRLVDRLQAAGLAERRPDPVDRRGELVTLTPEGEAALRRTWPVYARGIQEHFARHLADAEAETLTVALGRVRTAAGDL